MGMKPGATSNIFLVIFVIAACNGHGIDGSIPVQRQIRQHGAGEVTEKCGSSDVPIGDEGNDIAGNRNRKLVLGARSDTDKVALNYSYSYEERLQGKEEECHSVDKHRGYADSCAFVRSHKSCQSVSKLLDYTIFFYCTCAGSATAGYLALVIWIVVLFYLLASTASDYFCCSVAMLSGILNLSPAVAGASLVALGNGAPDVVSSIAAFVNGTGNVGVSSVLGAALFVTTIVAGLVSICAATSMPDNFVRIEGNSFVRDLTFFLVSLFALLLIIFDENVYLWEALSFLAIYVAYAVVVAVVELKQLQQCPKAEIQTCDREPLLEPLIINMADDEQEQQKQKDCRFPGLRIVQLAWKYAIHLPLTIPRRMTIPVAEEDRWSRFYAVCSATLGPIMMAFLLIDGKLWWEIGICSGTVLGLIALLTTDSEHPPRRFVIGWVAGGFVMSILWFYLVAGELVAELVSLGVIFDISPTVLAITVLAWGNSVGDLVADVSLASCKSSHGVQTAVSGCYAGPMFNTLVGIGSSLVLAAARYYPQPVVLPFDPTTIYTVGFLTAALVWALFLLPSRGMLLTKEFGIGLLLLYFLFLSFRIMLLYR